MSKILKKLIPGAIVIVFAMTQLSAPVFAATETSYDAEAVNDEALGYLANQQENDGSVSGFDASTTEWTVVAVVAKNKDPKEFKTETGDSAVDFIKSKPQATTATDLENRVISLSAAGEDVTDLSEEMEAFHNNNQIGDEKLLNDDMFGIIAIKASGNNNLKPMAQDGYDYLLAHQLTGGGFSYTTEVCDFCGPSVDMTAAAIVAMDSAEKLLLINNGPGDSKERAVAYLLKKKNADGGFEGFTPGESDADSTSWALIALNVIGESVRNEANAARCWLLANQNTDGSFGSGTFTTPHAITALAGTTWLLTPPSFDNMTVSCGKSAIVTSQKNTTNDKKDEASKQHFLTNTEKGSVLAATTSDKDQTKQNKANPAGTIGGGSTSTNTEKSGPNYTLYGLAFLGLIAAGWFVIQSRQKQGI